MRTPTTRLAAVLALSLPLTGGLLLGTAPAASADVVAPGNGTVFSTAAPVDIRADYDRSTSENRLTLTSPGGVVATIATAPGNLNGGTLSYRFDPLCWTVGCSGSKPAPNGTWTLTQSGGGSGSSTFVTRLRPEAPTSVTASAISTREVRVSWRAGNEPDLTGFAVFEGSMVVEEVRRAACDGTSCSAVVDYANEGTGDHTYTVRASRSVAPGSADTLESAMSAPASARLESPPPPPPPAPSETASSEPQQGGSTGGGTTGGAGSGSGTGSGSTSSGSTGSGSAGGGSTSSGSGSGEGGASAGSSSGSTSGTPARGGSSAAPIGTGSSSAQASADNQAVAQRKAFALTFSTFGPKLGIPKLPPLPAGPSPAIAPELADGTFESTLPGFEEDKVIREQVQVAQNPTERVRSVVSTAFDRDRLLRSTAAALVLLLAGAHLRRWLGSAREQ